MVFFNGLNHGLNQWFKPIGLNQPTLTEIRKNSTKESHLKNHENRKKNRTD